MTNKEALEALKKRYLLNQNLTNLSIIILNLIKENKERYYNVSLDYYEYNLIWSS